MNKFIKLVSVLCELIFAMLTFVVLWEVFNRYLFGRPFEWTAEITSLLFPWGVFLGAILVTKQDGHIAIRNFRDMMPQWVQKTAVWLEHFVILAFTTYLAIGGVTMTQSAAAAGRKSPVLYWPLEWFYAPVVVGAVSIIVVYFFDKVIPSVYRKSGSL